MEETKKKSNTENGHYVNVANFEELIARISSYPYGYNPSRPELQLGNLQQKLFEGRQALDQLIERVSGEEEAVNHRSKLFDALPTLTTRVLNALEACGVDKKTLSDAKGIVRKFRGQRSTAITTEETASAEAAPTEETAALPETTETVTKPKRNSVSQQSYDAKIEHLTRLIALLIRVETYRPNEYELTIEALQTKLQEMRQSNPQVAQAKAQSEAARNHRLTVLYHEETGIVETALLTKKYVKSVFGAKSPQYRQVSRIKFRTLVK